MRELQAVLRTSLLPAPLASDTALDSDVDGTHRDITYCARELPGRSAGISRVRRPTSSRGAAPAARDIGETLSGRFRVECRRAARLRDATHLRIAEVPTTRLVSLLAIASTRCSSASRPTSTTTQTLATWFVVQARQYTGEISRRHGVGAAAATLQARRLDRSRRDRRTASCRPCSCSISDRRLIMLQRIALILCSRCSARARRTPAPSR